MPISPGARQMGFWGWLAQPKGLIQGDPNYYATGQAQPAEYTHALRTAIQNLPFASDPTAVSSFWEYLVELGAIHGDPAYYHTGQASEAEIDHAIDVASRFFNSTPMGFAPIPPPVGSPTTPGTPTVPPVQGPTPVDYRSQAAALFPFLPAQVLDLFATHWANTGNVELALAETRRDPTYNQYFPGIRRTDGSLRMSEAEYLSRMDGFRMALGQFGLNPQNFENRFVEMIEGELTVPEFAGRLTAAYENIISQAPQLMNYYAENYGLSLTPEAVFASFIDPDLGDSILNQRISVSQIGGAAAVQGFDLDLEFAERLRQSGLNFARAQEHFAQAAFELPALNTLAGRFDLDRDFDITEFSQAGVMGDPRQLRRVGRLRAASASEFTDQLGTLRTDDDFLVQGLTPR